MTRTRKRGWIAIACAVLVCAAVLWQSGEVYALSQTNIRQLTRGLVWTGFRNLGTQGGVYNRTDSRSACRMTYPGQGLGLMLNVAGPDYLEYWGINHLNLPVLNLLFYRKR